MMRVGCCNAFRTYLRQAGDHRRFLHVKGNAVIRVGKTHFFNMMDLALLFKITYELHKAHGLQYGSVGSCFDLPDAVDDKGLVAFLLGV